MQTKEKCILDLSNVFFNTLPEMAEMFESFITLSDDLPDELILSEKQFWTYYNRLNDLSILLGFSVPLDPKKLTFRGLKIKIK
jgi:hypothetical protein